MRASGAFGLDEFVLLELTGEDRRAWLQGQATNDVRGLEPGSRASFCLCEPTGQVLAVLDAWAFPDRILMTTARACAAAVLDRVERMTILEDVAARLVPFSGVCVLDDEPPVSGETLVLRSSRIVSGGWDVWGPADEIEATRGQYPAFDPEASRIAAGVPKWGADVGPRTLPAELGPDFEASHVSYAKGCYTGQEVLMRMHSRGHTNRTWVGLVAAAPLSPGETVAFDGKEVGRIASAASSTWDGAFVAAATLRNEAAQSGARVLVGGREAEVRPMPLFRGA